jgi:hypothetical protein
MSRASFHSLVLIAGVLVPALSPRASFGQTEASANYYDPQGSVQVGLTGGGSFSSDFNYGIIGASVGYAVFTGVVPGLRGAGFFGDLTGGEIAGTLTLTPPIVFPVVPFVMGEIGHAWQNFNDQSFRGLLAGGGGGIHLGQPTDRFTVRAGVIYRYYDLAGGQGYISPILSAGIRF